MNELYTAGVKSWLQIARTILSLKTLEPPTTAFVRYREKRDGVAAGTYSLTWCPLSSVSAFLKVSIVAAEDPAFFQHHGFSWRGIRAALRSNWKHRAVVSGGSTITQQLAKNLFLTPARTFERKAAEAIITVALEWCLSKDRILELYINVIEWGRGVWGCHAASAYYLDKEPSLVGAYEAAFLASLVAAPRRDFDEVNLARMRRVQLTALRALCKAGCIDLDECIQSHLHVLRTYRILRRQGATRDALTSGSTHITTHDRLNS